MLSRLDENRLDIINIRWIGNGPNEQLTYTEQLALEDIEWLYAKVLELKASVRAGSQ